MAIRGSIRIKAMRAVFNISDLQGKSTVHKSDGFKERIVQSKRVKQVPGMLHVVGSLDKYSGNQEHDDKDEDRNKDQGKDRSDDGLTDVVTSVLAHHNNVKEEEIEPRDVAGNKSPVCTVEVDHGKPDGKNIDEEDERDCRPEVAHTVTGLVTCDHTGKLAADSPDKPHNNVCDGHGHGNTSGLECVFLDILDIAGNGKVGPELAEYRIQLSSPGAHGRVGGVNYFEQFLNYIWPGEVRKDNDRGGHAGDGHNNDSGNPLGFAKQALEGNRGVEDDSPEIYPEFGPKGNKGDDYNAKSNPEDQLAGFVVSKNLIDLRRCIEFHKAPPTAIKTAVLDDAGTRTV